MIQKPSLVEIVMFEERRTVQRKIPKLTAVASKAGLGYGQYGAQTSILRAVEILQRSQNMFYFSKYAGCLGN
jgi:hypothetical protein